MKTDITKFRFSEIFSNSDGKTSGSGFAGIITIFVGLLGFIAGVVMYWVLGTESGASDILFQSIVLVGSGTVLLGIRKTVNNRIMSENRQYDERLNS